MGHKIIKILWLGCLLYFTGCKKEEYKKLFDAGDIALLSPESIESFWENDFIKDTSDVGMMSSYPGYIDGVSYFGNERSVRISVYESQAKAIGAEEMLRKNVACVIQDGNSDMVSGKWWFRVCIPHIVIVNQRNTIIEVGYYHTDFQEIEHILHHTANELAQRVDSLSR